MKVVILMGSLTMGGAERVATTLASYLSEHRVETYLISFDNKESSYTLNKSVNFLNIRENIKSGKISGIKQRLKFMFNCLNDIKPNLIFTMFWDINLYAFLYKLFGKHKVKLVSSERCNPNEIKGIRKVLKNFSSNRSDGFVFQTERAKACYSKKIQVKSIVIHNAIGNPLLNSIDKSNIMSEKLITTMGRLEEQKAHDVMIKACAPVLKKHPEYKLVIYGEGSLRRSLENLIESLDMKNNIFLPGNTQYAINDVAKSQIFLLTSRYEGMPNALMEAMSLGIPCISTDCDMGPAELIEDEVNGYLVPVDDIESITQRLEYLIENENQRMYISENSKQINETHSIDKIYSMYLLYFKEVIGGEK